MNSENPVTDGRCDLRRNNTQWQRHRVTERSSGWQAKGEQKKWKVANLFKPKTGSIFTEFTCGGALP